MAIDPQEVNAASHTVLAVVKQIRDLSAGMIDPVAGTTFPHADTIAALKAEAAGIKANWQTARDTLDASLTP